MGGQTVILQADAFAWTWQRSFMSRMIISEGSLDRSSNLVEYNGFCGGRVFKWYTRPAFERHLRQRGWNGLPRKVEQCTEQECMAALRATSDELLMFPMLTSHMVPYGGPQCFPPLRVQSRLDANVQRQVDDDLPLDANAHSFTGV